ncbi:MAG: hypothetical protein NUW13_04980, partial [candidate division KSB1 bacterium]|nr:hypothetical protein [candidate division KSB1 bacterium]
MARKEGYGWKYIYDVALNNSSFIIPNFSLLREVEVGGNVTQNTVWEGDRHYIVTSDIVVPTGVTLAIEPGAVIRFDGYYKLRVEGRLISIGEEKSMIVFTSNMENPKQGDWNRIEFNQAEGDSKLSWARVEWANRGVDCEVSSPLLEHGVIRHAVTGLVANSGSDPRIEGNWVSDCEIG